MGLKAAQQDFYNHLNSSVPLWIYANHPIQGQVLQLLHIPNNKEKRDEQVTKYMILQLFRY